ncbi:M56 family metallopeptidase [Hymenobacter jejuensis]|uniref:M56 family peptidase n=1 Tax=Hymenobacter jejuensis TaxID=2502781 RepID=A0A5B7ZY37_9BACT|nr:M56 family metallopeptidase [Hymenobacter jejuensis]QDA59870.1 hypothetical protein FHG12_07005 [Hymenobacter jejuensis]
MPALLLYLVKANGALVLFGLAYYVVLRRLTFYTLNRAFLLFALLFSAAYPLLDIGQLFARQQELGATLQLIAPDWQALAVPTPTGFDYWQLLVSVYWVGMGLMAARLLGQLASLYRLHRTSPPAQVLGMRVRRLSGDLNPFSFGQTIYLNPEQHRPEELPMILQHEQVHVSQGHTLDVLLAQAQVVAFWFNPAAWLLKQAIQENLEFVTDRKVLQTGLDSRAYQYSLVRLNGLAQSSSLVNNFNFLTLKNRIAMINKKRSSAVHLLSYALLLPLVAGLAIACSQPQVEPRKPDASTTVVIASNQKDARTQNHLPDNLLYFVDGQEVSKEKLTQMDPAHIASMNVLKGEAFQKAFGSTAAGVVSVITKGNENSESVLNFNQKYGISLQPAASKAGATQVTIKGTAGDHSTDASLANSLIVIDGQEATNEALRAISPERIESVKVYKGEAAEKEFGAKGKNGVIVVATKK